MSLWMRGGKIIVDSAGKLIECDECPCDYAPYPYSLGFKWCTVTRRISYSIPGTFQPEPEGPDMPPPELEYYPLSVRYSNGLGNDEASTVCGGQILSEPYLCDPYVGPDGVVPAGQTWNSMLSSAIAEAQEHLGNVAWSNGPNYTRWNTPVLPIPPTGGGAFASLPSGNTHGATPQDFGQISQSCVAIVVPRSACTQRCHKGVFQKVSSIKLKLTAKNIQSQGATGSCSFPSTLTADVTLEPSDDETPDGLDGACVLVPHHLWPFGELPSLRQLACADPDATELGWSTAGWSSVDNWDCLYAWGVNANFDIDIECLGARWTDVSGSSCSG